MDNTKTDKKYIDANKLKANIPVTHISEWGNCRDCKLLCKEVVDSIIDNEPAANVLENRRGYWMYDGFNTTRYEGETVFEPKCSCSVCGKTGNFEWEYCPYCGTKM